MIRSMNKKSIQIVTLGCSKNQVDSEHILAQVRDDYEIIPEGVEQDVDEIGRASVGKECVRRCRSRWSPYH